MNRLVSRTVVLAALLLPLSAQAHKLWLQPSATVLTPDQWITVDAAVSNDLFYFNHVPLRLDSLQITAPDGEYVQPQNPATGHYRSVFDVELDREGTWRIALVNDGLMAFWEENGERRRWRGTAERFAEDVPEGADNLRVSESVGRVETFVTAGAPTEMTLKPSGRGLELLPQTHPNDLYAQETATFRFLVDGEPASGIDVEIVRGGTRYRNQQEAMSLTTDDEGIIEITWPEAGLYHLEAGSEDDKTTVPQADRRRLSYAGTFEVLPQ